MFLVGLREDRRGRGVTVLSRDKQKCRLGWEDVVNAGRWVANIFACLYPVYAKYFYLNNFM